MALIDIENDIFSDIADEIRAHFPEAHVTGEYVKSPPYFPSVSIVEADNSVYRRTQTGEHTENHAQVLYEVNVYSNKTSGKKTECREIMSLVDGMFARLGFTRTLMNTIPDMYDATIYRMVARYQAVIGKDFTIYKT